MVANICSSTRRILHRGFSESGRCRYSTTTASTTTADSFRSLMRHIPQPVGLVMTRLPDGSLHGATLSSFTSIGLYPEPIVSFSLRLPSRLASALSLPNSRQSNPSPRTLNGKTIDSSESPQPLSKILSVSLLSVVNQPLAHTFSQALADHEATLSDMSKWNMIDVPTPKSRETIMINGKQSYVGKEEEESKLPIAKEAIGGMICQVLDQIPLARYSKDSWGSSGRSRLDGQQQSPPEENVLEGSSMLFIARVLKVMERDSTVKGSQGDGPLLHLNRRYIDIGGNEVG